MLRPPAKPACCSPPTPTHHPPPPPPPPPPPTTTLTWPFHLTGEAIHPHPHPTHPHPLLLCHASPYPNLQPSSSAPPPPPPPPHSCTPPALHASSPFHTPTLPQLPPPPLLRCCAPPRRPCHPHPLFKFTRDLRNASNHLFNALPFAICTPHVNESHVLTAPHAPSPPPSRPEQRDPNATSHSPHAHSHQSSLNTAAHLHATHQPRSRDRGRGSSSQQKMKCGSGRGGELGTRRDAPAAGAPAGALCMLHDAPGRAAPPAAAVKRARGGQGEGGRAIISRAGSPAHGGRAGDARTCGRLSKSARPAAAFFANGFPRLLLLRRPPLSPSLASKMGASAALRAFPDSWCALPNLRARRGGLASGVRRCLPACGTFQRSLHQCQRPSKVCRTSPPLFVLPAEL